MQMYAFLTNRRPDKRKFFFKTYSLYYIMFGDFAIFVNILAGVKALK